MGASFVKSIFAVALALVLVGCSVGPVRSSRVLGGRSATSSATATATASAAAQPTPTSPTSTPTSNSVSSAIKAVIEKANAEQQQAFAQREASIMRDTATSQYYAQIAQINQEMANAGISGINLIKIEWGPVSSSTTTSAQATTYETWQTSYSDGSTSQRRDRNVYTLVQEQGAWKIQSDEQPDSNVDEPSGQTSPAPGEPISPPSAFPRGQSSVSNNWSGYSASNGTYTGVTGTWTVPSSSANGSFASGATWVGIGGSRSRDLIQAGTEETTVGSGQTRYDAWIEMLPQASHPVPLAVRPGDSVTVSIDEQGTDNWLIAFKNNTNGQSYQTTVTYASSLSSAEWVVEAPSARRQLLPLDNFGTIQFSGGSAIQNGKSVTIAQSGARPITMVDFGGNPIAVPSALSADGSGFSVSRATANPRLQPGGGFQQRPGRLPGRTVEPLAPLGPSFGSQR